MRRIALALVALGAVATCSPTDSPLQEVKRAGVLRMATVNSATTYYLGAAGATGFEYDLASRFAQRLGAELDVVVVPDRAAAITAVRDGRAHFAAGLAITPARERRVRFTPPYMEVQPQLVYRAGDDRPASLADVAGRLTVPAHVAVADWLRRRHPEIEFHRDPRANSEELLHRVASGDLHATVADANLVKLNQRYYTDLRVAFDLGETQSLAWAFPADNGTALYNKAVAFIEGIRGTPQLNIIRDRYYGHVERLGFVGGKTFARQVEERLPRWRDAFQRAAEETGVDWRLLAAIGYQESHWNPDAVSPTKVRGLMMLTRDTAREVGVDNRRDPLQSIRGGAAYFTDIRSRLPERIREPDRTWIALAAYNIGMGHVMDVRRLLDAAGKDPDTWVNIRAALPWLTQERYYRRTRYGYARGYEAVGYVGNIRAYYDILLWMTSDTEMEMPEALTGGQGAAPPPGERALEIDTPVL
ncbi:membrane-bound lytic transglycosylase F [Salinisphaera sp. PC39]|uniref:membrane-bound lytic murein transglycosylase MltF n=1 Tax=Salinisphaera sp. PC39 TaxID=1304156 RepID=UPI00333EDAD5